MTTGVASPDILSRLVTERPSFHAVNGQARIWHAQPRTLELIARHVRPSDRTLETGCGASTVVFAAAGARHTAISPSADEHQRISDYCRRAGIDDSNVSFVAGSSDRVLPGLVDEERLDLAFIDGAHSFPYPVIDWHYVSRRLRPGGILIMDDINVPSVAVPCRAMRTDGDGWQALDVADDRAQAFEKLREPPKGDKWKAQAFNAGYPDYSFAPFVRATRLRLRHQARAARSRLAGRVARNR